MTQRQQKRAAGKARTGGTTKGTGKTTGKTTRAAKTGEAAERTAKPAKAVAKAAAKSVSPKTTRSKPTTAKPANTRPANTKATTAGKATAKRAAAKKAAPVKIAAAKSAAAKAVPTKTVPTKTVAKKPIAKKAVATKTGKPRTAAAVDKTAKALAAGKIAKGVTKNSAKEMPKTVANAAPTGAGKARSKAPRREAAPPVTVVKTASKKPAKKTAPTVQATPRRRPKADAPRYLAAELGQPVDRHGEPIGAVSALAQGDRDLQDYAMKLWRQMQHGRVMNMYTRAVERAGFTMDDVWLVGLGGRPTSSSPDEMRRYRQKLLFRANLLEAILSETVIDLHRLEGFHPTPKPGDEPASDATATPDAG